MTYIYVCVCVSVYVARWYKKLFKIQFQDNETNDDVSEKRHLYMCFQKCFLKNKMYICINIYISVYIFPIWIWYNFNKSGE